MSTALTINLDSIAPQIAAMLPPDVPLDRFQAVALAAIRAKPELWERCDRQSLFNAVIAAAQDGLLPDGQEAAIVPRKGRAVYQPMVKGIYKRVKSSGSVVTLAANVVYEGEEFQVLLGDEDRIVHRRDLTKVRNNNEVAVYAIAQLKDGTKEREVMTWEEVMAVRQASATPNAGPWVEWPGEMARKTVVRRLAKRLPVLDPKDEALHRTINRVDSLYDFGTPTPEAPVLPAAAAAIARAPRITEKAPTPPPASPRAPPRNGAKVRSYRDVLDAVRIALRDAQSHEEVDRILCGPDVAHGRAHFKDDALAELETMVSAAQEKWWPEQTGDEGAPEIIGQDKLGAG